MSEHRNNRPSLAEIVEQPVWEIAALAPDTLALLQEEANAALETAKHRKERIESAIAYRYGEAAKAERRALGKVTGTVRLNDGPVTVVADLPKRIDWDQAQLAALIERIRAAGEDPSDYVETSFKVPERRFGGWPPAIRESFAAARTVRAGKPSFRLTLNPEEPR